MISKELFAELNLLRYLKNSQHCWFLCEFLTKIGLQILWIWKSLKNRENDARFSQKHQRKVFGLYYTLKIFKGRWITNKIESISFSQVTNNSTLNFIRVYAFHVTDSCLKERILIPPWKDLPLFLWLWRDHYASSLILYTRSKSSTKTKSILSGSKLK